MTIVADPVDEALDLLVAESPRGAAERMLRHLVRRHAARGAALLAVLDDDLEPLTSFDIGLARLVPLQQAWEKERDRLKRGFGLNGSGELVLPLLDGDELAGVVLLDHPKDADLDADSPFLRVLAKAARAWRDAPAEPIAETGPAAVVERHRNEMLVLLNRHQWNISRVARALGTTRRTVYLRMQRYSIPRQKIPKLLKPLPGMETA